MNAHITRRLCFFKTKSITHYTPSGNRISTKKPNSKKSWNTFYSHRFIPILAELFLRVDMFFSYFLAFFWFHFIRITVVDLNRPRYYFRRSVERVRYGTDPVAAGARFWNICIRADGLADGGENHGGGKHSS